MLTQMTDLERAARLAMGPHHDSDPLPPGPNYSPFGYFRLAVLVFAVFVALLLIFTLW